MDNFAYKGPEPPKLSLVAKLLEHSGPLACDVETKSLKDTTPIGISFAISPKEAFYFRIDSDLIPWNKLANPNIPIIMHNSMFDAKVIYEYNKVKTTNIIDSCVMAQVSGLQGDLDSLCLDMFGTPLRPITDLIGKGKTAITMDQVPVDKVADRACQDTIDAFKVWNKLKDSVPIGAYSLESQFIPVALDMQRTGIRIDTDAVHRHRVRLEDRMDSLREASEDSFDFSPGSSKQLGLYLESLGYKVAKTKKGNPKLDKEQLALHYTGVTAADIARDYRSTQTLLTHLIRPLDEGRYINNGKIYPSININVTRTGRLSRSNPAPQNIQDKLRDIVIPSDGNVIYSWDFSQIELRWMAYMWEDKAMQDIFKRGLDIHEATANKLIDAGLKKLLDSLPETHRRTAKDLVFAISYLGNAKTLLTRKQIPLNIGKALIKGYYNEFPGIQAGIEEIKAFAWQHGYTETYLGRKRDESEKLYSTNKWIAEAALRELVNHVIQGSAAETLKAAMVRDASEPQFHTVHDEVLLDVEPDYDYKNRFAMYESFDTPKTIKVGPNWKEITEI